MGSSPLARGLRSSFGSSRSSFRIIPARAGFTPPPRTRTRPALDHPRSRGVYDRVSITPSDQTGSSPLARGLLGNSADLARLVRIIPARAGFTVTIPALDPLPSDHPRSRGVYSGGIARVIYDRGSSPLARGLRLRWPGQGSDGGIIPARAGFTPTHVLRHAHYSDHPRSRGVYLRWAWRLSWSYGSSPLARGLRWLGIGTH